MIRRARRLRIDVLIRLPGRAREALAELNALPIYIEWTIMLLRWARLDQAGRIEAERSQAARCKPGQSIGRPAQRWNRLPDQRAAEQRGKADQALELLADLPKTRKWLVLERRVLRAQRR